jgi:hypothetical protein
MAKLAFWMDWKWIYNFDTAGIPTEYIACNTTGLRVKIWHSRERCEMLKCNCFATELVEQIISMVLLEVEQAACIKSRNSWNPGTGPTALRLYNDIGRTSNHNITTSPQAGEWYGDIGMWVYWRCVTERKICNRRTWTTGTCAEIEIVGS